MTARFKVIINYMIPLIQDIFFLYSIYYAIIYYYNIHSTLNSPKNVQFTNNTHFSK